jgi:endonuclease/exonuclease/phosphatase family metal-dependent hydrolase
MVRILKRLAFLILIAGAIYYIWNVYGIDRFLELEVVQDFLKENDLDEALPSPSPPVNAPVDSAPDQLNLMSWNLYNFGRSKNAEEMSFIADRMRDFELVAVQEVSTSPAGAQAVARLADELGRRGFQWDYIISDPTTGDGSERYAYLWKTARVRRISRGWLEPTLADPIDREPYLARFEKNGKTLLIASFHAVPTAKSPHRECILLARIHDQYPDDNVVIVGDFNLDEDHTAFDALRNRGYDSLLDDQKTSLKMKRQKDEHLSEEYDNMFYETSTLHPVDGGIIDFTISFRTLSEARNISDHLPVYMTMAWK